MLLTADAERREGIPPGGKRTPPPCREGVRRVAENFKKNKKDYKLSFSY
nr:MAG TPA: NADH-ubiquinone oxidoreductase [Caudoviricetes sp.]